MTSPLEVKQEISGSKGLFFIEQGGRRLARLTLTRVQPQHWVLEHTEVDDALRGQGAGRKLLDAAVAWARQEKVWFTPVCPFAKAQFDKDETLRDVLAS